MGIGVGVRSRAAGSSSSGGTIVGGFFAEGCGYRGGGAGGVR